MGQITREQLEAYRSMQEEIRELNYKLQHLGDDDTMMASSTVNDYRSGYPVPQAVVGVDWDKVDRMYDRCVTRMEKLKKECEAIEEYIEGIGDSMTRRIFRMYFIDGLTQRQISREIHFDKSTVGRKIDKFLKVAPNAPNAPL